MRLRTGKAWPTILLFAVLAAIATAGCGRQVGEVASAPDRFEEVRAHVQAWLWETQEDEVLIPVGELKETIVDDWAGQQERYRIVSVRRPEHYAAGHIPYATNVSWRETVKQGEFEPFDPGKTTVAYCYIGHGSMLVCTTLNLLGRRCRSVHFGMMAWNVGALGFDPWDGEADYPVEAGPDTAADTFALPVIASDREDVREIIQDQAAKHMSREGSPVIGSADVKGILDEWGVKEREYQVVDVRSREEYEAGHVPHALNIPWRDIAEIENLKKIDPERTAIVYSDNGQTGMLASTVLNLLGYRSVGMRFGMMDWNAAQVGESRAWSAAAGYPVEGSPAGPETR